MDNLNTINQPCLVPHFFRNSPFFSKCPILVFMALVSFFFTSGCGGPEPSGYNYETIDTSREPLQTVYKGDEYFTLTIKDGSFTIKPVASYKISAMVAGKKHYPFNWESVIAPFDLALAWGKLAEPEYDRHMNYSQRDRWYFYHYGPGLHLDIPYIVSHSSNNHIIPSSENVLKTIRSLSTKERITIEGFLVNVSGSYKGNPVFWNSSLSRRDSGNGSCELFYVNKVRIGDKVYE
jgi:hypothetical protein